MLKIRRPLGRLIFNMGIAIPGKTVFLIETAPWFRGLWLIRIPRERIVLTLMEITRKHKLIPKKAIDPFTKTQPGDVVPNCLIFVKGPTTQNWEYICYFVKYKNVCAAAVYCKKVRERVPITPQPTSAAHKPALPIY